MPHVTHFINTFPSVLRMLSIYLNLKPTYGGQWSALHFIFPFPSGLLDTHVGSVDYIQGAQSEVGL